jgi:peptide/nickel transport system ATP-binding protein
MKPILQVQNLQTYFATPSGAVKAVDGVSFDLFAGETLGLVGESGSGKSVTALSILRLVSEPGKIVGGKILFQEKEENPVDLLTLPPERMREVRGGKIAMIFQEPMTCLNPVFTVGDQIEEAVVLHQTDLTRADRKAAVIESLRLVKIPDPERVVRAYPHELSGGMRQRIMIAMALSCRPAILIADEPTTALDVTVQAQVLDLLRELRETLGMSLLLITHDLGIIAETVKRTVVMYAGRIVEESSTADLFANPRHPYTRALLKSLPTLEKSAARLRTIPGTVPSLARLPQGCAFQDRCDRVANLCRDEAPALEKTGDRSVRCYFPESTSL